MMVLAVGLMCKPRTAAKIHHPAQGPGLAATRMMNGALIKQSNALRCLQTMTSLCSFA